MSIIGDAYIAIRPDSDGFGKDLESGLGKASARVAKVGAAAGAAAVAGIGASVKVFADFDQAMTNSVAIMGDVSDTMRGDMADAAREVAKTTQMSASEAAESYFFLASAGLDAEQSIAALPRVAAFAQAGNFDMARATDLATDAQSALGLASDDTAENLANLTGVTDVFVRANELANTSVEQVSEAITQKAGGAMRSLNIDMEEGVATLAAFADQGVKGSEAGVMYAATMEGLTTNARKNADEFDRLGVSVFNVDGSMRNTADIVEDLENSLGGMSVEQQRAELAALGFNRQALTGIQALMGNSDALREYESELRGAGGTVDRVASKQMETFWAQLGLVKDQLLDVGLAVGEQLMPYIMDLVATIQDNMPAIQAFVERGIEVIGTVIREVVVPAIRTLIEVGGRLLDWWRDLSPAVQTAITTTAKIVAGFVVLLPVIMKVIAAVKVAIVIFKAVAAIIALVASPIGLVVAAVVGLAFVIYKYWDEIVEATRAAWDWVVEAVTGAWEWIKATVSAAADAVVSTVSGWVEAVVGFVTGLRDRWIAIVDAIRDGVVGTVSGLVESVTGMVQGLRDRVTGTFGALRDGVLRIAAAFMASLVRRFASIRDRLRDSANTARDRVVEAFRSLRDRAVEQAVRLVSWVSGLPRRIIRAIPNPLGMLRKVGTDIIQGLINGVKGMASKATGAIADVGRSMRDRFTSFFGVRSPSRLFAEYGRALDEGLAVGIMDAADRPVDAIGRLSERVSDFAPVIRPTVAAGAPAAVQGGPAGQAQTAAGQMPTIGTVNIYSTDPKRSGDEVIRSLRERAYLNAPLGRS